MPDADRFERKLRGKGWRSVYRLGCSGAPLDAVADKVMGAVTHVFRTESIDCLSKIFSKLVEAIDPLRNPLFRESLSLPAFETLSHEVQAIETDDGFSEMSRMTERAALRTFNEIDLCGEIPSKDVVAQRMTKNLVSVLLQRRCLSPVRDGIMENNRRNKEAQLKWELELNAKCSQPCASLSKSLFAEDRKLAIRAPKRLFKPMPMTLETLNQPLQVLGESR
jgi:hypothetical protein